MVKIKNKRTNRIGIILEEKQLSNKEFSLMLGKSENTISYWTTNSRQPSISTLYDISKALEVDISELLVSTKEYFKSTPSNSEE